MRSLFPLPPPLSIIMLLSHFHSLSISIPAHFCSSIECEMSEKLIKIFAIYCCSVVWHCSLSLSFSVFFSHSLRLNSCFYMQVWNSNITRIVNKSKRKWMNGKEYTYAYLILQIFELYSHIYVCFLMLMMSLHLPFFIIIINNISRNSNNSTRNVTKINGNFKNTNTCACINYIKWRCLND